MNPGFVNLGATMSTWKGSEVANFTKGASYNVRKIMHNAEWN